jgi:hypothetical protein
MKPGRPATHVTIAARRLSGAEAGLAGLSVSLGRFSHDRSRVVLWPSSKFASVSTGSEMKIELGVEDDENVVWSGKVSALNFSPEAIVVEGLAPTAVLIGERKSQTYFNQGAADVVRDLASNVDIDNVDTALQLDYYAVDTGRSVWGHLTDLAGLAGAEITISPSGGLRFVEVREAPASKKFSYGIDVLDWQLSSAVAPAPSVYAVHGAGSEAGKEKWHWISEQSTTPARVIGAFQSQAPADALNDAASTQAQRSAVRGRLRLVGSSDLRAGDVFKLEKMPGGSPGDLRACSVTHHFSGSRGFWTDVAVQGSGAGSVPGGLP